LDAAQDDDSAAGMPAPWGAAFMAAPVGLACAAGPEQRLTVANPALAALLGRPGDALAGRTVAELLGGPALGSGEARAIRAPHPDGRGAPLRATLSPLPDGTALLTVERLEPDAGFAPTGTSRQIDLALSAADIGTWHWEAATDRLGFSAKAAEILAVPPGTAPTRTEFRERIDPQDRARVVAAVGDALDRNSHFAVEYRLHRGTAGAEAWIAVRGHALVGDDGTPLGLIGTVQDVTEREEARRALRDREQRLRVATTAADLGIFEWHLFDDRALWENERMWQIFGRRPQDGTVGMRAFLSEVIHPDDALPFRQAVRAAARNDETLHATCRIRRGAGTLEATTWRVIEMAGRFERRAPGTVPNRLIGVVVDVTDRQRAEERQTLLIRELHHRVKNTLATVQAIVGSTARTASSIESFYEAFVGRIMSLAHTHSVLTEATWQTASLRGLLENELRPYADGAMTPSPTARVSLEGPPVDLPSEIAVPIGMAIHELTTNAAKYGALSNRSGRVEIAWSVAERDGRHVLDFAWRESGGPPVTPPTRRGFGSRLLDRVLTTQVQAEVRATYAAAGFQLAMQAPLPERNPALNPLA
jgi:two-component sensor histidine kinase